MTRNSKRKATVPRMIDHDNMQPLLDALQEEPCYQPGLSAPMRNRKTGTNNWCGWNSQPEKRRGTA